MTLMAVVICSSLFIFHFITFLSSVAPTRISIDRSQDKFFRINFDIEMLDLPCEHVSVNTWDDFGMIATNVTANIVKVSVNHQGQKIGEPTFYSSEELVDLEFGNADLTPLQADQNVDADWASSSQNFHHADFQEVIMAHEYTLISFFADWCIHCRQFGPVFTELQRRLVEKEFVPRNAAGDLISVQALKINCVAFEEECRKQKVRAYPTVRLYRRALDTKSFSTFPPSAGPTNFLQSWVEGEIAQGHARVKQNAAFHNIFPTGCRLNGHLKLARVPGALQFTGADTKTSNINFAFVNVSHTIHHLSFTDSSLNMYGEKINPLDGQTFVTHKFHQAPHHNIKVITQVKPDHLVYQFNSQYRLAGSKTHSIPVAKFVYDLASVSVIEGQTDHQWYGFLTSLMGVVGGTYTIISLLAAGMTSAREKLLEMKSF